MSFFPDIILYNPYYIGDTVLLISLAEELQRQFGNHVYIATKYTELLDIHPTIKAIPLQTSYDQKYKIIDLEKEIKNTETIKIKDQNKIDRETDLWLPNKLECMCKSCGLDINNLKAPKIYLSNQEMEITHSYKRSFNGKLVGFTLNSRNSIKDWPYFSLLFHYLLKNKCNLFCFAEHDEYPQDILKYPFTKIYNKSLREVLPYIKAMDLFIGVDTGLPHIAAALDIQTVVIGYEIYSDLYKLYNDCNYIGTYNGLKKHDNGYILQYHGLKTLPCSKVINRLFMSNRKRAEPTALLLLEGLGGTITLSDHVKKIAEKNGNPVTLIIRKHSTLFEKNPYVEDVIEVGNPPLYEIMDKYIRQFNDIAILKSGIGRWFKNGKKINPTDKELDKLWETLPQDLVLLEKYNLNWIQITDKSLGLPYDTVESKMYNYEEFNDIPCSEYVVVNNGFDTWHQGRKQSKCWDLSYWNELIKMLPFFVIQIGTTYDEYITGAYDLRGKTNIPQFSWLLKNAKFVVGIEGGVMHLGYAVGQKNMFILRGPTKGHFFDYPGQHNIDSYICTPCYFVTPLWHDKCLLGCNSVCMDSISPIRVVNTIKGYFDETMAKNTSIA